MRPRPKPLQFRRFALLAVVAIALAGGFQPLPAHAADDPAPPPESPAPGAEAPAKPARIDAFTLTGTLSSANQSYAFFDGTDQEYKQVYHVGEKIGGYTVSEIAFDHVKLKSAKGEVTLALQMQLRREAEGDWKLQPLTENFTPRIAPPPPPAPSTPSGPPPPTSGGRSSGSGSYSSRPSSNGSAPSPAASALLNGMPPEVAERLSKKLGNVSEADLERLKMLKSMREMSDKTLRKLEKRDE